MAILLAVTVRCLVNPRANSVYPVFANAARNWLAKGDLYELVGDPYRYSPLVAALLVPLGILPDQLGGVLWRLANAGVYLGALAWWGRSVLPQPLSGVQQALLFLLVVPLSTGNLNNGQSNALVLGLLLAAVAGVASARWNWAAAFLALACLFKLYPIAVGLLLAVVSPRRFAGRLLVALTIGLVLPFVLQHPDYVWSQYQGWLRILRSDDRQGMSLELWYRDLRLLCQVCHAPLSPRVYLAIQVLAAAGVAAVCVAGRWAGRPPRALLTAVTGLGCCWMTLLGSATESCTYILLAPTLAWAVMEAWLNDRSWRLRATVLASYCLFTASNAAVWVPGAGRKVHSLGVQPLAALMLAICLLVTELQQLLEGRSNQEKPTESLEVRTA
jgi:hypothetical protein